MRGYYPQREGHIGGFWPLHRVAAGMTTVGAVREGTSGTSLHVG